MNKTFKIIFALLKIVAGVNYKIKMLVCEKDSTKPNEIVMDYKVCIFHSKLRFQTSFDYLMF